MLDQILLLLEQEI